MSDQSFERMVFRFLEAAKDMDEDKLRRMVRIITGISDAYQDDAIRYRYLRGMTEALDATVDALIAEDKQL